MSIGIKHGYPILRESFFDYVALIRPFTAFIAFLVGWLLGVKCIGLYTVKPFLIGLSFAMGQIAGQVLNQIVDIEIDRVNKPYRPLVRGAVSLDGAYIVFFLSVMLSIIFSLLVSITFFAVNLLLLFFAVFYSLEPIRAKKYLWSYPWMAVSRGLLPPVAVSYGVYNALSTPLLVVGLVAFTWVLAYQVTKDIGDEEGDRLYNIKTIPVVYGRDGTVKYMWIMSFLLLGLVTALIIWGLLSPLYFIVPVIGFLVPRTISKETITENNMGWTLFYAGLGLIFLLFLIS